MEDPLSSPYSTLSSPSYDYGLMDAYQNQPNLGNAELNVMLDDVSRQMAMSNLSRRRSSRHSANTSSTPARTPVKSARVSKIIGEGNSPKPTVRRTTSTSAATARRGTTTINTQQSHQQTPPQQLRPLPLCGRPSARPTTWHPSSHLAYWQQSLAVPDMYHQGPANSWGLGLTTTDGILNEPSTPSMYSCSDAISPFIPTSPLTNPFDLNEPDIFSLYASDWAQSSGPPPQCLMSSEPEMARTTVQPTSHPAWVPPASAPAWPQPVQSSCPGLTSLSTSNGLPRLSVDDELAKPMYPLVAPNPDGKVLLGMGLYDDVPLSSRPGRGRLGLPGSMLMGGDLASQPATGKGLKLEETWEPPSKEDGNDEGGSPDSGSGSDRDWEMSPVLSKARNVATDHTPSLPHFGNGRAPTAAARDGYMSAFPTYPAGGWNPAGWI